MVVFYSDDSAYIDDDESVGSVNAGDGSEQLEYVDDEDLDAAVEDDEEVQEIGYKAEEGADSVETIDADEVEDGGDDTEGKFTLIAAVLYASNSAQVPLRNLLLPVAHRLLLLLRHSCHLRLPRRRRRRPSQSSTIPRMTTFRLPTP